LLSPEPDFLQQNYQCLPAFNTNLSAMPTWLAGLNAAGMAVTPPVPIQFCMATPMELLASIALPTVTNFRASNDFFYGGSCRLRPELSPATLTKVGLTTDGRERARLDLF
jgi:hypothetical protein